MEREKLLDYVAPCSLLCYSCTGFKDGPVLECAKKLYTYLDGFGEMCGRNMPQGERHEWCAEFNKFRGTLQNIGGTCPGCRKGPHTGCIEGCVIPPCAKERGVEFCAECSEFPCQRAKDFFAGYDGKVGGLWVEGSKRIREIGIGAYFEEKKGVSHYLHYTKNEEK